MGEHVEEPGDARRSRREVVRVGAAGVIGALAAGALAPGSAAANDGDPLILGTIGNTSTNRTDWNAATTGTALVFSNSQGNAMEVSAGGNGFGIAVDSSAVGAPAVLGGSPGGCGAVQGLSNTNGSSPAADIGVYGASGDANGVGVFGENLSSGTGVTGESSSGTGVQGVTTSGTALAALATDPTGVGLYVEGTSSFQSCGVATVKGSVASPKSSVKVTLVNLSANSLVLATIQTNNAPGTFIQSAVPNAANGWITITLNQTVTKPVKVAWFVINPIPIA